MYTGRMWIVLLCFLLLFGCLFFKFTDSMTPSTHSHIFLKKTKKTKHLKTKNKLPTVLETGNSSHWSKNYQSVLGTCSDISLPCHKFGHDVTANKCPGLLPTKLPSSKYHLCNIQILSLVFNSSLLESQGNTGHADHQPSKGNIYAAIYAVHNSGENLS